MEYPTALGILALFFGLIGMFALVVKTSPEPPPKGGVHEGDARMSFAEYRKMKSSQRRDAILAQRRVA